MNQQQKHTSIYDENGKLRINGVLKLVELDSRDFNYKLIKGIEEKPPLSPNEFNIYAYPELRYRVNHELAEDAKAYQQHLDVPTIETTTFKNQNGQIDPIFVDAGVDNPDYIENLHNEIDKKAKAEFERYTKSQSNELLDIINDLKSNPTTIDDENFTISQKLNDFSDLIEDVSDNYEENIINRISTVPTVTKRVERVETASNDDMPKSVADLIKKAFNDASYNFEATSNNIKNDLWDGPISVADLIDYADESFIYVSPSIQENVIVDTLWDGPKSVADLIDYSNEPFIYEASAIKTIPTINNQKRNSNDIQVNINNKEKDKLNLTPKFTVPLKDDDEYYKQVLDSIDEIEDERDNNFFEALDEILGIVNKKKN